MLTRYRQQLLKACFIRGFGSDARLRDMLQLGFSDDAPEVRSWAVDVLKVLALRDFEYDTAGHRKWHTEVIELDAAPFRKDAVRRWIRRLKEPTKSLEALKVMDHVHNNFGFASPLNETNFRAELLSAWREARLSVLPDAIRVLEGLTGKSVSSTKSPQP